MRGIAHPRNENNGNLYLAVPMLLAAISATAALAVGVMAIVKNGERSPLVFLAVLLGLLVTAFWVVEIATPH